MQRKSKATDIWAEVPRNQIFNCDCVEGIARLPEACIPLVVTSPPYDGVFRYSGHPWNFDVFKSVADQLWRVIMPGGVICWEVKDQCTKSGFTGTMYRQVLYFQDTLGFRLHEKLYIKSPGISHQKNRYPEQIQELFVLSKGSPKSIHRIADRENSTAGDQQHLYRRDKDGVGRTWKSDLLVPIMGLRTHLWEVQAGFNQTTKDDLRGFPAPMPEQLARDLIRSYSKPEDLILDPFSGSGTTAKMAMLEHRDYLGFEIWDQHYRNSVKRLKRAKREYQRKLDRILVT
jgi:site-specific DNA-methyltransferase (adenine-specific)